MGGIRSRLESVGDATVSTVVVEMEGGNKGLIINSRNLCGSSNRATVKLTGQNGKTHDTRPVVRASCGKKRKHKRSQMRHR